MCVTINTLQNKRKKKKADSTFLFVKFGKKCAKSSVAKIETEPKDPNQWSD